MSAMRKSLLRFSVGSFWIALVVSPVQAAEKDFATMIPENAIFVKIMKKDTSGSEPKLSNFTASLEAWQEAMDDVMEWRIVCSELDRLGWMDAETADGKPGFWSQVAGSERAVAVFVPSLSEGAGLPIVLYMTRTKDPAVLEKSFEASVERMREQGISLQTESNFHEDIPITSHSFSDIRLPGLTLSTATVNGTFVLCTSPGTIQRVIDAEAYGEGSLGGNPDFKRIVEHLPTDHHQFNYVNVSRIGEVIEEVVQQVLIAGQMDGKGELDAQKILDTIRPYLNSVTGVGNASRWTKAGKESLQYTAFADEVVQYPFGAILESEPKELKSLQFLSRKTQSFTAGNILTLETIWKTIQNLANELAPLGVELQPVLEEIQAELGGPFEETLFPWLGSELAYADGRASLDSIVPVKPRALMLEVEDEAAALEFVERIVRLAEKKSEMRLVKSVLSHPATDITTYQIPLPMIPVQPTVCVIDGMLIIGTSSEYVEELLDVHSGEIKGLGETSKFKSLSPLWKQSKGDVVYNDISRGLLDAKNALERVQAMGTLAGSGMQMAAQSVDNAGNPNTPFGSNGQENTALIMNLVQSGLSRAINFLQIFTVIQANGAQTVIEDRGMLTTNLTTYRDLHRRAYLDVSSRGKISFFAEQHLLQLVESLDEQQFPFKDDLALYLTDVVARYIPDQSGQAYAHMAKLYTRRNEPGPADEMRALAQKHGWEFKPEAPPETEAAPEPQPVPRVEKLEEESDSNGTE